MLIGLEGHILARRRAKYHVQVEITDRPVDIDTTANVSVEGRVVRVFRSTGDLDVGSRVTFKVPVYVEREGPPTGPTYLAYRTFVVATHMEVYLDGDPPQCRIACEEFEVIPGCSETPFVTVAALEELEKRIEERAR